MGRKEGAEAGEEQPACVQHPEPPQQGRQLNLTKTEADRWHGKAVGGNGPSNGDPSKLLPSPGEAAFPLLGSGLPRLL